MSAEVWRRITILRGIAALYVVLHHIRNGLWWMLADIQDAHGTFFYYVNLGMAALFWHGLPAVLAFFVISGISIHAPNCQIGRERSPAVLPFYRRRLSRLYPALIASMVVAGVIAYYVSSDWVAVTLLRDAVGTLLFQQTVLTDSFAHNSPYWSLANEGWYYLVYPLLAFGVLKVGIQRVLCVTFATIGLALLGFPKIHLIIAYYPIWILGAWIAHQIVRSKKPPMPMVYLSAVVTVNLLASSFVSKKYPVLNHPALVLITGLGLGMLIWFFLMSHIELPARVDHALHQIGDLSYSLYLFHFPIISLVVCWHPNTTRSIPQAVWGSLIAMLLSLACAWLSYRFIEKRWMKAPSLSTP